MLTFFPNRCDFSIKTLRCFVTYILIIFVVSAQAQEEGYFSSKGESEYFDEIEDIFKSSSDRSRGKDFLDRFEEFWYNETTPDHVKEIIIEISDFLHDKRASAFPNYHLFLTTIESFVEEDHSEKSLSNWHKGISGMMEQRRFQLRHLNEVLETTHNILNKQKIFSTQGVEWISQSPDFEFILDNDSLKLSVGSTKLVCHARNDSITIHDTGGVLNIVDGQWEGHKGKITWKRSGFDGNQVYALFDDYSLNMERSNFTIEDVSFFNTIYFDEPLKGSLEHKVRPIRKPSSSNYPRFESYEQVFNIENIHPGMHYEGGFSQHGAKFRGSGTTENPAKITIERNDTLFITAQSLVFSLREDEILSKDTEVTMHLDTGEINHPGLQFKYMAPSQELYLIRDGKGMSQSPFFDAYHKVTIDTETIHWALDEDHMELRMLQGASRNQSFFESLSYFRESFFRKLQGMDAIHPLQGLKKCYTHHDEEPFTAKDYAQYIKKPKSQTTQQIIELSFHGFLEYNTNTDTIRIKDRLTDYLKFRSDKKDYDVIKFKSVTPGKESNAIFDLKNYDFALNGVEDISISDHQNVVFLPKEEKVTLKYNRNFNFNGRILAGMISLLGDGFFFSYDNFRIDMKTIDSMQMKVATDEVDEYGRPVLQTIDNTVAKLSGHLQIDSANNKSGKEDYPRFPVLVSDRNAYVYYEREDIQEGAYNKDNFYFDLKPFKIDSINDLTRENILFDGKLISNIFPELEEQLTVRNDYSLGFVKQSPSEGYPIYDNKARFFNEIDLSNEGLKGEGKLEYLTSQAESESFTFLPNETKGIAQNFEVEPQTTEVEYPDVQGQKVDISFLPEEEKLTAEALEENFELFEKETSLEGRITLSPGGIEAGGTLSMSSANLISEKMELSHHALKADSADFNLTEGEDIEGVSFKTDNLSADIDFEERQGRFSSRDVGNKVEFSDNLYIAYISEFSWNMDRNNISMGASGSEGNRFVSTHRGQDSLDFKAPLASYDIESKTIKASEVSNIEVADANILLKDGIINIQEDAEMSPFDSATIELNNNFHTFHNANVTVKGKYEYSAEGEYTFTNGDMKEHTIYFDEITFEDEEQTYAQGSIEKDDYFTFDEHFSFNGDVELAAGDSILTFDGGVQMLHQCSQTGPQDHVRFNAPVNPYDVTIPLEERTFSDEGEDREELVRGFYLQLDSTHVYSAFLEESRRTNNETIISAGGHLIYNDDNNCFEIAREEKLAHPDSAGNIIRYHAETCQVSGEGELDLGMDLERVNLNSSGIIKHLRKNNEILINGLFGADFFLDETSLRSLTNIIAASEAPEANHDQETVEKQLREWMPAEEAKNLIDILEPTTDISEILPSGLQKTLFFTDIEFSWDTSSRSYVAEGKADLGWINDQTISREVDVKALISRSRGGNSFEIHIQAEPGTWFFFSYNNEKMLVLSSSDSFNNDIRALETEERKMKSGIGEDSYIFQLGSKNRLRRFMEKFEEEEVNEEDSEEDEEDTSGPSTDGDTEDNEEEEVTETEEN